GLRHHEPHRILEDERQEDSEEHDQEDVADLPERSHDPDRGDHDQDRAYGQQDLGALELARAHGADSTPGSGRRNRAGSVTTGSARLGRTRWAARPRSSR